MSFTQMLERARRRDEEALMTLYQRAVPIIYRYVLARLGRPDVVEDVVAEVFLVMVESIGDLRAEHEAGFYAWLIQIAQGKIARALRRQQRQQARLVSLSPSLEGGDENQEAALAATDLESNPAELQEWRETLEEVGLVLGSLTSEQQVVVIGRFLAGQSIDDLARALNKKPGSIRALQFRAMETLAQRLGLTRRTQSQGRRGQ